MTRKIKLMLLFTILSWGLIAEKEPGCPMWGELPSIAEYPDDQGSSEKRAETLDAGKSLKPKLPYLTWF